MAVTEISVKVEDLTTGDEIVAFNRWSFDHGTQLRTGSWVVEGVYWMANNRLADVYTDHGLLPFNRGAEVTVRRETADEPQSEQAKGQEFAAEMRHFLSIGTRTRRDRKGLDLHREIADWIKSAAMEPGSVHPDQEAAFRPAFNAACSWFKWINLGRADYTVIEYVNSLSPYQFCAFLGQMIDDGITTTSQAGTYFSEMRTRLLALAA